MRSMTNLIHLGLLMAVAISLCLTSAANADTPLSPFEGFFDPSTKLAPELTRHLRASIFKITGGDSTDDPFGMQGTAFAFGSDGLLLTNSHNVTECLRAHGLEQEGYDGKQGPIDCGHRRILSNDGRIYETVKLIAASGMKGRGQGIDLAVISIPDAAPDHLTLSGGPPALRTPTISLGYPGRTFRSRHELQEKRDSVFAALSRINDLENFLVGVNPDHTTTEALFTAWQEQYFVPLQKMAGFSNVFSGAMIGDDLDLFSRNGKSPTLYLKALSQWTARVREAGYNLLGIVESGLRRRANDPADFSYPNADGGLRLTEGEIEAAEGPDLKLTGDGVPGSSGSPIMDRDGRVLGILFLVDTSLATKATCSADAWVSDFESIFYSYCDAVRIIAVQTSTIRSTLSGWGIHLPD